MAEANTGEIYQGSRKHILDWVETPTFAVEILKVVAPINAAITADSLWMPRGYAQPTEARLERFLPVQPTDYPRELQTWWLLYERGANTPNWDLVVQCQIEGRSGLLLIEAKANLPELRADGKPFSATASENSRGNHERIGEAIAEARQDLKQFASSVAISRDTHYQLSNRLAFAWKLARLGIPTILIYLGFVGDTGLADIGQPFHNGDEWYNAMTVYAGEIFPESLWEKRLDITSQTASEEATPLWFLVRSRPVIEPSPRKSHLSPSR
jgi:hypothetical protein